MLVILHNETMKEMSREHAHWRNHPSSSCSMI